MLVVDSDRTIPSQAYRLLVLVFVLSMPANAAKAAYQSGTVLTSEPLYLEAPPPLPSSIVPIPKFSVGYSLQILAGGSTYVVSVVCCSPQSKYKPEWTSNEPIEFRFDKNKMFIKRPNGKEVKATLIKVVKGNTSPSLSFSPAQAYSHPSLQANQNKKLSLGVDFLRGDDGCLTVYGDVEAGEFFNHLHSKKTANGTEFAIGSRLVKTFPDRLMVRVIAEVGTCSAEQHSSEGVNIPRWTVRLDEEFMKSITFEGWWKRAFDEKLAELGPVAEGRIPTPTLVPSSNDWWQYEFEVRAEDVSLSDSLVILIHSPNGKMVARLSARLPDTL